MAMDLAGFAVSAGSACSSGKVRQSRVLRAMGYDAAQAGMRHCACRSARTTEDEIMRFAESWLARRCKHQARTA